MSEATQLAGLLEACRRGDTDAFRALFEAQKDRVFSIAVHYTGDHAAAMDISQDVFVKLYRALPGFRGDTGVQAVFEAWLYRLTVNACLDHRRRSSRWVSLPDLPRLEHLLFERLGFDDGIEAAETSERVRKAVTELSPELRIAVVLRYLEGLSYEEIAAATAVPAGTVASRLNRAHKILARRLRDLAPRGAAATGEVHGEA